MSSTEPEQNGGLTAETNPELAALAEWVREHEHARARMARHPLHVGYLRATTTRGAGRPDRTIVQVRDSRRASGRQYSTVLSLDDVEIKVGNRFLPAREVVGARRRSDDVPPRGAGWWPGSDA